MNDLKIKCWFLIPQLLKESQCYSIPSSLLRFISLKQLKRHIAGFQLKEFEFVHHYLFRAAGT
jgi:hypothetical protein